MGTCEVTVLDLKFCPLSSKFCYLGLENPNKFMQPVLSGRLGVGWGERCWLLRMAGFYASLFRPMLQETLWVQNINRQNMEAFRVPKLSLSLARFGGAPEGLSLKN